MSKPKKILKGIGITLAVLIIALAILRIMLPGIIVSQTAKQIPKNLNAEGSLGNIALALLKGSTTLNDFTLGQPEGFGEEPLFHASKLHAAVSMRSLLGNTLKVKTVELDDATVNIVRNKEGIMNLQKLAKEPAAEPKEASEPKPIVLEQIRVKQFHVNYFDHALGDKGFSLTLTNITVDVDQLMLNGTGDQLSDIAVTAGIIQPGRPEAQLGIFGKTGPIGADIPDAALAVQLIGFELATIKDIAPTGPIEGVLGGKGLDLNLQAKVKSSIVDCAIALQMDSGGTKDMSVRADLTDPEKPVVDFDKSAAIFLAFEMVSGPILAPFKNIGAAAGEVVGAVTDTATEVVADAGKVVGDVGKGLFGGLKKLAQGDVVSAVTDVAGTAVGAVEGAGAAVGGAAENLGEGALKSVETAAGMGANPAFLEQIDERKIPAYQAARDWVGKQDLTK